MHATRRDFLKTAGAASSLLVLPGRLSAAERRPANARLQLAMVGVGGRGKAALSALQSEQIVAFCDVDHARAKDETPRNKKTKGDGLFANFGSARWFHDYRVMFEQMADQIDAVIVSVPDHMHYAVAMAALRLRKHVYVEKPLCRCITEVRALHAAAKQAGVVTQMGNQGRAAEGIRLAREWVQAGLIGRVHEVHAWNSTASVSYSYDLAAAAASPDATIPPSTLHYDLWLGVAPERPYQRIRSHGSWRGCPDYGSGRLGDWGCHQIDAANFALDLGAPRTIEAASTEEKKDTFPAIDQVTWEFPARETRPAVNVRWFGGGLLPPEPVRGFKFGTGGGSIFYGDKGILWVGSHSSTARLLPEARMAEMRDALPPKTIPRVVGGPHVEFVNAIRHGTRCGSDFDYSAPLAETVLLGVAAVRARTRLVWDAKAGRVMNHAFANEFIGPGYAYRPGWGV